MSIHIPSVDGEAEPAIVASSLPEILPVLPLRDSVPFPDTLTPLAVGQERSVRLVNDVLGGNRMLVMVASKDPEDEEPGPDDLYSVGVAGVVSRMLKMPDGTLRILVHGAQRVRASRSSWPPAVPGRPHRGGAGRGRRPRRSSRRCTATCRRPSRGSSRRCPTSPRSCRSRWRTSTTPRSSRT